MKKDKDSIEEIVELSAEETMGTEEVLDAPLGDDTVVGEASVGAPVEETASNDDAAPAEEPAIEAAVPEEAPIAEGAPAEEPLTETPVESVPEPAPEPAPAREESAAPGYGAPQMLYEDFIPYEYLHDVPPAPEKPETPAEQEPAPESEEKKKKKDKKPSKEEEELLAAVEAEMASRSETAPEVELAPAPAPAATEAAPVIPVVAPAAPAAVHEEAPMAENNTNTPPVREYSSYEKKLRRKYGLDKDVILSQNDVVPGFVLAKGENVVRCYYCLNSDEGEGTLCVTNKRLLINADERSEVEIERVTGVKFLKNTSFSVIKLLFALAFSLIGGLLIAIPFIRGMIQIPFIDLDALWKDWFRYLFLAVGGVDVLISLPFWFTMVKKYFRFNIFVKDSASFLEVKSGAFFKKEKKGKMHGGFMISKAGKESEKAARELGALILEIKAGRYDF